MYQIKISEYAKRQFKKLDRKTQEQLAKVIRNLQTNPRPFGYKKMVGREAYRVRSGDYRIIYEIEDDILLIHVAEIGHRREIYN